VLDICQHRLREKNFLRAAGVPLPRFMQVESADKLRDAVAQLGTPCVLKTASFGYDGKGQAKIEAGADLEVIWAPMQGQTAVVEAWASFEKEISVLIARGADGAMVTYPVCENRHAHHILDLTIVPADVPADVASRACEIARHIAVELELVGLLAVEMFLLPDGQILVNELAPRPHNSGHFSFDACVTSQFEQQLRAVCGLPLGSTELLRPCAMANLLGDLWSDGEPQWTAALERAYVKLHLYGKTAPRPGRKMGHLVAFGGTPVVAAERALAARAALTAR
jgi:5-(carboxyamino)imidazole ribonucleotide synthase